MSRSVPPSGPLDVTLEAVDKDLVDVVSESRVSRPSWLGRVKKFLGGGSARTYCSLAIDRESECDSSSETRTLLRGRLRAVGWLMTIAFSAFLAFHVAALLSFGESSLPRPETRYSLLATHIAVTIVIAAVSLYLTFSTCVKKAKLQAAEWTLFGAPVIWGLHWQYLGMTAMACDHHVLPPLSSLWLIVIFAYALFVPRGWKHSAVVLTAIASAPLLMTIAMLASHPEARAAENADAFYVIEHGLVLAVAVATGVVGVAAIHRLRREAFDARRLGQYRLGALIGEGGMGEVYLAEHQMMKRPCAVKVIRPEKAGDPTILARFEREVRLTARLSHWNTVDIYDYGQAEDGTFYYVMEYLPGLNLKQLVTRFGPLSAGRTLYLLRPTCEALAEAHGKGLIHRDIKPANVFAAHRGGMYDVAKLLDFGLARPIVAAAGVDIDVTNAGSITGSPLFMSPEQALGEEPDERSDIYSLGAVAYYLLSGRPPFESDNAVRLIASHLHEAPAPLREIAPDVPADLEQVVMACLRKNRADRYQSAEELLAALSACRSVGEWGRDEAAAWWNEMERVPSVRSEPALESDAATAASLPV